MKMLLWKGQLFSLLLIVVLATEQTAASQNTDITNKAVITNIEKAILQASEWHEKGKIQKGAPLVISVASDLSLIFTAENFDADLDKAFQILDQLMSRTRAINNPSPQNPPVQVSTRSSPMAIMPSTAPPQGAAPGTDRLAALMQAEKQTRQSVPAGQTANMPVEYSVYDQYRQSHQGRRQEQEKMIEAEKQMVIAERQAAAQNQQRKRDRDQQLQSQAGVWQTELDKQAKASAAAALQWEEENSFGAYMKRFLGVVIQTSVGAFTSGFLGTVSFNLANQAVGKLFPAASPNIYTQSAAAGTSAAITQTGTAIGQSFGQQAAASVAGQSSGTAQTGTSTTPSSTTVGQSLYTPPKY